jgi:type IV fimbrial biogenesis protein FimT
MGHQRILLDHPQGRLVRRLKQQPREAGFTMVELLVTIAIFALLAAMAVPTLRTVMANSRIRAAAQSLQNGLAMARNEAVRLNTQVEFVMTAGGWSIQRVDGLNGGLLQQASGKERASGITLAVTPSASDRVTFDAFGRRLAVNPTTSTGAVTRIDIRATSTSGLTGHKPLRVEISGGGAARVCDTAVASTEPKACIYSPVP